MRRKIVIDIDNTLWDFAPTLYNRIKKVNPAIPPPSEWHTWDFWKPYLNSKELYELIREIHMEQDRYGTYPDARQFLVALKKAGFYIIIASHREKGTYNATAKWLVKHELPFDEIHLSQDKSVLFNDCWAVVDDSPITLDKAEHTGIIRVGLKNPWNEKENHPLFDTLMEIYQYLRGWCLSAPEAPSQKKVF